ncbi:MULTISPECIES: hypothetical protein [unclassified Micromonospora]|uniref:hypothetical protein n=1 Tax=unclassified Micromonospora TaxID=2617518 RepID=UPI003A86FFF3
MAQPAPTTANDAQWRNGDPSSRDRRIARRCASPAGAPVRTIRFGAAAELLRRRG